MVHDFLCFPLPPVKWQAVLQVGGEGKNDSSGALLKVMKKREMTPAYITSVNKDDPMDHQLSIAILKIASCMG